MYKKIKIQFLIKRIFDLVFASLFLIIFLPIIILISLLILISGHGPIFYASVRVGRHRYCFKTYKFRTMRYDSDLIGIVPVDSLNKDYRITPLGRFLRKTSLDEIPLLFNVIRGEMSLVGPRSQFLTIENYLTKEQKEILFSIRPGITGFSQIQRLKKSIDFTDMIKYDIWYINNWSFILDIKIIFMTFFVSLKGKGAY